MGIVGAFNPLPLHTIDCPSTRASIPKAAPASGRVPTKYRLLQNVPGPRLQKI